MTHEQQAQRLKWREMNKTELVNELEAHSRGLLEANARIRGLIEQNDSLKRQLIKSTLTEAKQ